MKQRSEWLLYILLALTGGLFGFIWIFILMYDVNRLEGTPVFPVRMLSAILSIGFLLYFCVLFFPNDLASIFHLNRLVFFELGFALGLSFVTLLVTLLILVYRHAKTGLRQEFRTKDALATIGLFFVMGLSFILVQQHVNRLTELKETRT